MRDDGWIRDRDKGWGYDGMIMIWLDEGGEGAGGRECLDRCTYTVEEWMGRGNMILHYSLLFTFQNSSVCVVTTVLSLLLSWAR